MKIFSEEDIFRYLDDALSQDDRGLLEAQVESSPSFKKKFNELLEVHESLLRLNKEPVSPGFSDKVMQVVGGSAPVGWYGSNSMSGLSFILFGGILTGLVAMASLFLFGYLDFQVIQETLQGNQWSESIDLGFIAKLLDKKNLTLMIIVIYTILSFVILDKMVIGPWLLRRSRKITFRLFTL